MPNCKNPVNIGEIPRKNEVNYSFIPFSKKKSTSMPATISQNVGLSL